MPAAAREHAAPDQQQRRARHSAKQQAHSDANAKYCSEWLSHGETAVAPTADPAVEEDTVSAESLVLNDEFAASFSAWGNSLHDRGGWVSSTPRGMSTRGGGGSSGALQSSYSVGRPLPRQRSLDVALDAVTASFRDTLQLLGRSNGHSARRSLDVLLDDTATPLTELPPESATTWSSSNFYESELLGSSGGPPPTTSQAETSRRQSARSSLDVLLDKAEQPQLHLAPPSCHVSTSMTRSCSSRDVGGSGGGVGCCGEGGVLRHYHSLTTTRRGMAHYSMDALMEHGEAP